MVRLRKLLADSSKARRHRRKILNVQITFVAWLAESVGFLVIFLGTFILGHENNIFNFFMQSLTLIIYFNILPSIFLINDSDIKSIIVDSNVYGTILTIFNCNYVQSADNDGENSSSSDLTEDQNVNRHGENNTNAGDDSCYSDNKQSQLFKRTFKEATKEHSTRNENEHESNNDGQIDTSTPSCSNDVMIIDLEAFDDKTRKNVLIH